MDWQSQLTVVVSIGALLISAVTAALNLFVKGKRDRFEELDSICNQQWSEIDNLKSKYEESKTSRERVVAELEKLRADNRCDTSIIKADMTATSARVDTGVAVAKLAAMEAANARNLAVRVSEETNKSLAEISETGKETHKIVNNQRTVMLRQVARLSRLYARDHPDDNDAQIAAEQAEKDIDL